MSGLAARAPGLWRVVNDSRLRVLRPLLFGGAVCQGPKNSAAVALTFDDGPDPDYTPAILDALERAGARATFFFLGRALERHPDLGRRVAAHHEVGTHLYSHSPDACDSSVRFDDEARRALALHEQILGVRPRALRFPFGRPGRVTESDLARWGLASYHWTFSSEDSSAESGQRVVEHVLPRLHAGAIVLLHDGRGPGSKKGRGDRRATVEALPRILEAMATRNLRAAGVTELCRAAG